MTINIVEKFRIADLHPDDIFFNACGSILIAKSHNQSSAFDLQGQLLAEATGDVDDVSSDFFSTDGQMFVLPQDGKFILHNLRGLSLYNLIHLETEYKLFYSPIIARQMRQKFCCMMGNDELV